MVFLKWNAFLVSNIFRQVFDIPAVKKSDPKNQSLTSQKWARRRLFPIELCNFLREKGGCYSGIPR